MRYVIFTQSWVESNVWHKLSQIWGNMCCLERVKNCYPPDVAKDFRQFLCPTIEANRLGVWLVLPKHCNVEKVLEKDFYWSRQERRAAAKWALERRFLSLAKLVLHDIKIYDLVDGENFDEIQNSMLWDAIEAATSHGHVDVVEFLLPMVYMDSNEGQGLLKRTLKREFSKLPGNGVESELTHVPCLKLLWRASFGENRD